MRTVVVGRGLAMLAAAMVAIATMAGCGGGGSGKSTTSPTTGATNTTTAADSGKFCDEIKTSVVRFAGLLQPGATPDQIRASAQDLAKAIKSAVAAAAADIKADATVVAGAADDYLAALKKADYDQAKLAPADADRFQAPDVAAAFSRIQAYAQNTCGIRN